MKIDIKNRFIKTGAILTRASLIYVSLIDAVLTRASMIYANLIDASLDGANF